MEMQLNNLKLRIRHRSLVSLGIRSENVYLVVGTDTTGRKAWYYLHVHATKKRQFDLQSSHGSINLNDFGSILLSAYGDRPPEDVVKRARDEFGFESA